MTNPPHFRLSEGDFSRLVQSAKRLAGVRLSEDKVDLVYARLMRRLYHLGVDSFAGYCDLINQPGSPETDYFIDALTTHVTSFFRERYHFDFVEREVWPALKTHHTPRIWSAGCSSGQEAYSLAISLQEALGPISRFWIRGTDISAPVIAQARRGVYSKEELRRVSPHLRRRYFQRGTGKQSGFHRVKELLRQRVGFDVESLLSISVSGPAFDLIMCRNVLIYFSRDVAESICRRLVQRLVPGGYLILGHSEGGLEQMRKLRQVGPTCYIRMKS